VSRLPRCRSGHIRFRGRFKGRLGIYLWRRVFLSDCSVARRGLRLKSLETFNKLSAKAVALQYIHFAGRCKGRRCGRHATPAIIRPSLGSSRPAARSSGKQAGLVERELAGAPVNRLGRHGHGSRSLRPGETDDPHPAAIGPGVSWVVARSISAREFKTT